MANFEGGAPSVQIGNAAAAIAQSSGGIRMGVSESVNVGKVNAGQENSHEAVTPREVPQGKAKIGQDPRKAADWLQQEMVRSIEDRKGFEEPLRMFAKGEFSDKDVSDTEVPDEMHGVVDRDVAPHAKNPDPEVRTDGEDLPTKDVDNSQGREAEVSGSVKHEKAEEEFVRNKSMKEEDQNQDTKKEAPESEDRITAAEGRLNHLEKRVEAIEAQRGMTRQEIAALMAEIIKQIEEEKDEEKKMSIMMILVMAVGLFMKSLASEQDMQPNIKATEKKEEAQNPISTLTEMMGRMAKPPVVVERKNPAHQNKVEKGKDNGVKSDTVAKAA